MKVQAVLQGVVAQVIRGIFGEHRKRRGLGRSGLSAGLDALEPRTLLSALPSGALLNVAPLEASHLVLPMQAACARASGVSERLGSALQVSDDPAAVVALGARSDGAGQVQAYVRLNASVNSAMVSSALSAMGLAVDTWNDDMHVVEAWVNSSSIDSILSLPGVASLDLPDYGVVNTGAVDSAGDGVLRANLERTNFGFGGNGVKVGVISNGVNHRANSVASGDLPTITVNSALSGNGDEGTAMLEIVHDLAPNASLYFSAGLSSVDYVNSVTWLRNQGCNVIIDDVTYFDQPFFADGAVAQAAQGAVDAGVAYVTSAGNAGTPAQYYGTSHYQAAFHDDGSVNHWHNFNTTGVNIIKSFYIDPGTSLTVTMQWSEAFGGATSNYGLYIADANNNVIAQSTATTTTPCRSITINNNGTAGVIIGAAMRLISGNANRQLEMFGYTSGGTGSTAGLNYATSGDALVGQEALSSVICVGATNASDPTHAIESFSSQGPSTIMTNFATQTYTLRQTLDITATDGVETEVGDLGYFPINANPTTPVLFFGTSAAAPHVAAIAALMLQAAPTLTPAQVEATLESSALDLGTAGYDNAYGAGLARADYAIASVLTELNNGTLTIIGTSLADTIGLTTTGGALSVSYNGVTVTPSGTINAIVFNGGANDSFTVNSLPTSVNSLKFDGGTIDLDAGAGITQTFDGVISGSAAVVKTGSGTWVLNGANTFSGGLTASGGVLRLGNALAAGTDGVTVNSGASLDLNGQTITGHTLTLNGTGYGSAGALTNGSTTAAGNWSGPIVLASDTTIGGAGNMTLSGVISGNFGLTKTGAGTTTLTGNNTFSGKTRIANGVLSLDGSGSMALAGSTVDLDGGDSGTLSFGSLSAATIGGLMGTRNLLGLGTMTLTIGGNGESTTYSGILVGTGTSFVKQGNGTLTLCVMTDVGSSGTVTVNAGALVLEGNAAVAGLVVNDGSLTIQNNGSVSANTLSIAGDGNVTLDRSSLFINQSTVLDGDGATVQLISEASYGAPWYGRCISNFWGGSSLTLEGESVRIAGDGHFGADYITAASGVDVNLMPGIIAATMEATPEPAGVIDLPGVIVMDLSAANEVTTWINVYPPGYPWGSNYINSYVALSNFMTFNDNTFNRVIVANAGDTDMNGQTFATGTSFKFIEFNYMNTITLWSGSVEILGDQGHSNIQDLNAYWISEGSPWAVYNWGWELSITT
jgi:autotransporter-associated beta strand protein